MATAYRDEPQTSRQELLAKRDALVARGAKLRSGPVHAEVKGLCERLKNADRDPVHDVEGLLRDLAMTVEAAEAESHQRVHKRSRLFRRIAFVLGTGVAVMGLSVSVQLSDYNSQARFCANEWPCSMGQCHAQTEMVGPLILEHRCVALTEADCKMPCIKDGECAPVEGDCTATEAEHCAESDVCRDHGLCGVSDGKCRALTDAQCEESMGCRQYGYCSVDPIDDRCTAADDDDCAGSVGCANDGECTAVRGVCQSDTTPTSADCVRLAHCVETGFCDASEMKNCDDPRANL